MGVTRRDRIRNEYIRGTAKVTEISKKIQESRLRLYGHLKRRVGKTMWEGKSWKWKCREIEEEAGPSEGGLTTYTEI